VLAQLCPDLAGTVTAILFEHSPSRGDPAFTGNGTAFDALLRLTLASGALPFVAIEVKYGEGGGGPAGRHITDAALTVPRFTRLFADPATTAPTQHTGLTAQIAREALLATAMLEHSRYAAGRLLVIAPALNREAWSAVTRFRVARGGHADLPGRHPRGLHRRPPRRGRYGARRRADRPLPRLRARPRRSRRDL
jgi:hypothetical protein